MRAPTKVYRTWHLDSRRWDGYRSRGGDVVIATFPKCGTTWMQQIVSLLIFQSATPRAVTALSPWIDARFITPIEEVQATIEAQTHRRFLKSHLPFHGLPKLDALSFIHVARDGLDAFMSWHNHTLRYRRYALLDAVGLGDETIARPYPRPSEAPAEFFRGWMGDQGAAEVDFSAPLFFETERSFWSARGKPNVLLVHYNDLLDDLEGEMCRVASFLGIKTPDDVWPELLAAATFEAMKRDGELLMPHASAAWEGGHQGFLFKGENGRWARALGEAEIRRYRERAASELSPGLCAWLERGRARGDPAHAPA